MSNEAKRLRDRAAAQLRQGRRRTKLDGEKTVHNERAAALKEMAHNAEWLDGDPERSRKRELGPSRTRACAK